MNFEVFWLLGSVIVALDIYLTLKDDPIAMIKYSGLDNFEKFCTILQLLALAFLGSWLIVLWRVLTWLYVIKIRKLFRRRK